MRLYSRALYLRIEFDESWAYGYFDLPIPNWFVRLVRLKTEMDDYGWRD